VASILVIKKLSPTMRTQLVLHPILGLVIMTNPSSEVAVTGFLSEVKVTKFMSEAAGTEPFDSFSIRSPGRLCGDLFQRFNCIVRYKLSTESGFYCWKLHHE